MPQNHCSAAQRSSSCRRHTQVCAPATPHTGLFIIKMSTFRRPQKTSMKPIGTGQWYSQESISYFFSHRYPQKHFKIFFFWEHECKNCIDFMKCSFLWKFFCPSLSGNSFLSSFHFTTFYDWFTIFQKWTFWPKTAQCALERRARERLRGIFLLELSLDLFQVSRAREHESFLSYFQSLANLWIVHNNKLQFLFTYLIEVSRFLAWLALN